MTEGLSIYGMLLDTLLIHDGVRWAEHGSRRAHDDHIRSSFIGVPYCRVSPPEVVSEWPVQPKKSPVPRFHRPIDLYCSLLLFVTGRAHFVIL